MLDDNGEKIPVTGEDGEDAITPRLKIEDGYWFISYDGGLTWTRLGEATGEDGKESARVRKGIPAGLPFFPTVETVCTARAKRLPEAGWVFFLRGGRPVFVFLKGRNG